VRDVSVQAWFSYDEVDVEPGTTLTLTLTVQNLGESTDSFTIVPAGLSASWTTVQRGNITLFGGSQDVIDVEIKPPQLPTTTAGPTVVAVRVIPTSTDDEAIVAEATLAIQPFDDRRIVALQPVQRSRRRATFEFMVENHGNSVASARLLLIDPTNRIDGSFDPPAVGVAPGASNLVRLRARSTGWAFRHTTRTLDFEIEAESPGHAPAAAPLALVQPPTIPGSAMAWVGGILAALLIAAGLWVGLVRPAIDNAVTDQVNKQLGTPAATSPGDGSVPATTVTGNANATVTEGEPSFFRLTVTPALTQTADQAQTIPPGQTFDLTDLRIENPFNDGGVATLSINGTPTFVWSLANVRGQFFEPRITPIRLQAGDNVTFAVRCDSIADPSRTTCTNAANVGGRAITGGAPPTTTAP
jgi:hypothetical protein